MSDKKPGPIPKLQPDEETLKVVRGLGRIQATTRECAAMLGVTEPTYLKFKAENPVVAAVYEEGSGDGKTSLRRRQFEAAEEGNPTMLVWLGKQYLGQRDHKDISGPNGGPIPTVDLTNVSDEQLKVLEAIFGQLAGSAGSDDADDSRGEGTAAS